MHKICKMMRRFQIWHHNSHRLRFDPFCGQKIVGNRQNIRLSPFDNFFAEKGVKSYWIGILRPDLESSHHYAYFRHSFIMIFAFSFFDFRCIFKNLKLYLRPLKVLEIDFFRAPLNSACLKPWETTRPAFNF